MKIRTEDNDWQHVGDIVAVIKARVEAAIRSRDNAAGESAHDDLTSAGWRLRLAERRRG